MSLVHNMKQTFERGLNKGSSNGYSGNPSMMSSLSSSIAMFYLINPNPSEEEMKKFADENKIEYQVVLNYFKERKNQDSVNANILAMKYGLNYKKPEDSLVKEFENSLHPSISDVEMNLNDIFAENIPKKIKKPEFQVINDGKNSGGGSGSALNSNSNSGSGGSNFSYSSFSDKNSPNSFIFNTNKPIDDPKQIASLVSQLKKETKPEQRLNISTALNKIEGNYCLNRFIQLNGNQILGHWIEDYKEEIESNDKVDSKVYEILTNILNFLDILPITVQDLKISKIGKKVNKLGKCVSDRVIKTKCEELVSRWKKMIEDIKEKKKDKHDKEREREREREKDYNNYKDYKDKERDYKDKDREKEKEKYERDRGHSRNSPSPNRKSSYSNYSTFSPSSYDHMHKKTKRDSNSTTTTTTTSISTSGSGIKEDHHGYGYGLGLDKTNKKPRHEEISTSNTSISTNNNYTNMNIINTNQSMMKKNNTLINTVNSSQLNFTQTYTNPNTPIHKLKSGLKKTILKKAESKKQDSRRVKFEAESKIEKIKVFKMTDEPGATEVTEEEYQKIQMEILKNPQYKYLSDMRSKEINMEKENMSKARDRSKQTKDILYRMVPQMVWRRPYEIKINNKLEESEYINEYDFPVINIRGLESEEKKIIDVLCQKILSVTYFRESEIPDCPKSGASQLFCFTDEEIPKLENLKKAFNSEKPNPNIEILDFIDKNFEATPSPDFIKTLIKKIQDKEFTVEESVKILDYLNKHSNSTVPTKETVPVGSTMSKIVPNFPFNPNLNMNNQFNYNSSVNIPNMPNMTPMPLNLNNNLNIPLQDKKNFGQVGMVGNMNMNMNMNNMNMPIPFNPNTFPGNEPRPMPLKYKTRPCRNFHGPNGCNRGDNCHFIHDPNYAGQEIPNFNIINYKSSPVNTSNTNTEKKVMITNVNIVNNYGLSNTNTTTQENLEDNKSLSLEDSNSISNITNEEKNEDEKNKINLNSGINMSMGNMGNISNNNPNMKKNIPQQFNPNFTRFPFMGVPNMGNMRPPFMNMPPQFMNQNPYLYMNNFMRPGIPPYNMTQSGQNGQNSQNQQNTTQQNSNQ